MEKRKESFFFFFTYPEFCACQVMSKVMNGIRVLTLFHYFNFLLLPLDICRVFKVNSFDSHRLF